MPNLFSLLAQAATDPTTAPIVTPAAPAPMAPAPGAGSGFLFALLLAMFVFMILSARSQKKRERTEREQLYARLNKNERVLTVGGVIGTIVSVKDNEVVLKVDDSTNTKMTFVKSAIQRIITDEPAAS